MSQYNVTVSDLAGDKSMYEFETDREAAAFYIKLNAAIDDHQTRFEHFHTASGRRYYTSIVVSHVTKAALGLPSAVAPAESFHQIQTGGTNNAQSINFVLSE